LNGPGDVSSDRGYGSAASVIMFEVRRERRFYNILSLREKGMEELSTPYRFTQGATMSSRL